MAAMFEMCPAGEGKILPALFLQRLLSQLRVLLTKRDLTDLVGFWQNRAVVPPRAGGCGGCWGPRQSSASCQQWLADGSWGWSAGSQRDAGGNVGVGVGFKKKPKEEPEISKQARLATGLCLAHWHHGKSAHSCTQPSMWEGSW
jgi:hypothetical protein